MTTGAAAEFLNRLDAHRSQEELEKIQWYFRSGKGEYGEGDQFMGVRMGQAFEIVKEFIDMPIAEIEKLLESPVHEARAGACSIMDKSARREEMYNLYLRRHDRINNWDLVDIAAPFVVGGYLIDRPRDVLYELARSDSLWERRTAIVATS